MRDLSKFGSLVCVFLFSFIGVFLATGGGKKNRQKRVLPKMCHSPHFFSLPKFFTKNESPVGVRQKKNL